MATPSTSTQTLTVALAFVAAAISLAAVALAFFRDGRIAVTPLGGGLLMLALGISGVARLRSRRP